MNNYLWRPGRRIPTPWTGQPPYDWRGREQRLLDQLAAETDARGPWAAAEAVFGKRYETAARVAEDPRDVMWGLLPADMWTDADRPAADSARGEA